MAHFTISMPRSLNESISDGLADGYRLARPVAVVVDPARRNSDGWPELVVAAVVVEVGSGADVDSDVLDFPRSIQSASGPVAAWVVNGEGGPCMAVNGAAREYSSWGAAVGGGSRMDDTYRHLTTLPEVAHAVSLVA